MSDLFFEEIDESEVVGRSRGKSKLPKWTPLLSWDRKVTVGDEFFDRRGYGQPDEEDFEEIEKAKEESLRKQNEAIDSWLVVMGIRKANVLKVRNQKEVRIKL